MNAPPAGTKCVDCGCCDAAIYAGDVPICWECDAGTHGAKKEPKPASEPGPKRDEVIVAKVEDRRKKCAAEGCDHVAARGYSYCSRKHYYWLRKEKAGRAPATPKQRAREAKVVELQPSAGVGVAAMLENLRSQRDLYARAIEALEALAP